MATAIKSKRRLPYRSAICRCGRRRLAWSRRCRQCYLLDAAAGRHVEKEDLLEMILSGLTPAEVAEQLGLRPQYVRNELQAWGGVAAVNCQLGIFVGGKQ